MYVFNRKTEQSGPLANSHSEFDKRERPAWHNLCVRHGWWATPPIPDALPAVTVPLLSLIKQGLSLDMASMLLPWRGNSSIFTSTGPEEERKRYIVFGLHLFIVNEDVATVDWNSVELTERFIPLFRVFLIDVRQYLEAIQQSKINLVLMYSQFNVLINCPLC